MKTVLFGSFENNMISKSELEIPNQLAAKSVNIQKNKLFITVEYSNNEVVGLEA